ncbi:hypothetical protein BDQ12DRAFT_698183 [Crucibulum laeve]|uniref:Uncharacterized protein n=1 Tax=Crucibulum laeve TaxID=68775 RepID=A0A5C3M594_9AGAR|nr:hypothetical protein BDQ12DRAFT_698183 [Crucibulum laeve]
MQALREPNPSYIGQNGFVDPLSQTESEPEVTPKNLQDALDRHRQAMYILTQKDSCIPTLEEMEEDLQKPETAAYIKEQIEILKDQHLNDLERIYAAHTAEYLEEQMHKFNSKDDTQCFDPEEQDDEAVKEVYERLESHFSDSRIYPASMALWEDDYDRMRYTHLDELHLLEKRHKELEAQEEAARKFQESQFPMSADDFYTKQKDMQLRAARFLMAEKTKQEKMLSEFGWAWRQVEPLKADFDKNVRSILKPPMQC